MPNAWNEGSARLLADLGFKALATTSAGLAYSLGRPDGSNRLSREETIANAGAIAGATSLPVSADLEGGFGSRPEDCARTIEAAINAGLAGGSIEDSSGVNADPIYDLAQAAERVKAASEAARASGIPFVLTARAENFIWGRPDLGDTIKRLQAFQEAGADVLFAPGLKTPDEIKAVIDSVDRPVSVVMGLVGSDLIVADLAQLGVRRVSVGGSLARAAFAAVMCAAQEIREHGTFLYAREAIPDAVLSGFFEKNGNEDR
jgi:2-methylisocitrate lyase-like PEP mutase family enzyme